QNENLVAETAEMCKQLMVATAIGGAPTRQVRKENLHRVSFTARLSPPRAQPTAADRSNTETINPYRGITRRRQQIEQVTLRIVSDRDAADIVGDIHRETRHDNPPRSAQPETDSKGQESDSDKKNL